MYSVDYRQHSGYVSPERHTVKYLVSLCGYHISHNALVYQIFLFLKSVTISGEVLSGLRENFLSKLSAFHKKQKFQSLSLPLSNYKIFCVMVSELQVPPADTVRLGV